MLLSVLIILSLFLFLILFSHVRLFSQYSHLPGPSRSSWVDGHVTDLLDCMRREGTAFSVRMKWSVQFQEMYLVWLYNTPQVCLTDGSLLHSYFSQPHEKFLYPFLSHSCGYRTCGPRSIFNEPGSELWAFKRRRYRSFFSQVHERSWLKVIEEHTEHLTDTLSQSHGTVDMEEAIKRVTFDIVCHMAFGSNPNSVTNDSVVRHSLHKMLSTAFRRAFFVMGNKVPFLARDLKRELGEAVRVSREYSRQILLDRLQLKDKGSYRNRTSNQDILDMIISCNEGDEDDMIDDVIVFMIAGYDTAANVLAFTVALLLSHPHIMDRAVEEAERVDFSKSGWKEEMRYINAVIAESMRLFPPGPVSHRSNNKEVVLAGHVIPKGAQVQAGPHVQHRLPRYWDNPDKFLPERWLKVTSSHSVTSSNSVTSPHSVTSSPQWPAVGSYIPYMVGPRNCIGKNLAEVLLRVVLCGLLKRLKFHRVDTGEVEAEHCFTLVPRNKVLATVTARQ